MNSGSDYGDKLDTIDLIITALKEHEKMLDSVISNLSAFTGGAERTDDQTLLIIEMKD